MVGDGLKQRALEQKFFTKDVFFPLRQIHFQAFFHFQVQQLLLVIPFVEGMIGIQPFVALQADQVCIQRFGHHLGNFRFADSRWPFYQKGFAQAHRQKHGQDDRFFGDVALCSQ